MPRLMNVDNDSATMETTAIAGMQAFKFSAKRIDHLSAVEYTLVTILVDVTGSVSGFEQQLRDSLITAVESCKKSPRANNLLLRVALFSTSLSTGISEIHGFKPLNEINPAQDYPQLRPGGMTNLLDAVYQAVGSIVTYSAQLMAQDFLANGIAIVITDGDDNASTATANMVSDIVKDSKSAEKIESLVSVLVGVNAGIYQTTLDAFAQNTGMKYIDAGEATKGKLAKLAEFVSQSVSSQSQSLGTGGPSQNIAATI